jgi:hypothetical protein
MMWPPEVQEHEGPDHGDKAEVKAEPILPERVSWTKEKKQNEQGILTEGKALYYIVIFHFNIRIEQLG